MSMTPIIGSSTSSEFLTTLSNDLSWLLENIEDCNVTLQVGREPNVRNFYAHIALLRARSSYFRVALSKEWAKREENGSILFRKPNISPEVFEEILKYIYRGTVDFSEQSPQNLLNFLTAGDELMLDQFCAYIQNFLIEKKGEWLEENLIDVLRITQSCKTLAKCIELIRFFDISSSDYYDYVRPYKDILPLDLKEDIVRCHFKPGSIPKSVVLPPRDQGMNLDSQIIKPIHARIICEWINGKDILGDGKNLQEVQLSRVRDSASAMYGHTSYGPHFGTADLRMYSPFNNRENCSCQQANYRKPITEHVRFSAEEYEVFQITPK
ncbi:980_t:CDS:2 [Diversispora eburnea]|uniref:980_t:CDS:1 n=1 Tax=Diversispora eburnea TaxID=1213867 RepID=A0A9N9FRP2_9GLOM|nr:980_t:CDS:2 [Diversispora eburnea]